MSDHRRPFLIALLLLLLAVPIFAQVLTPRLNAALSNAGPERLRIVVVTERQTDAAALEAAVRGMTPAQRRETVISRLREESAQALAPLEALVRTRQEWFAAWRPLWIVNAATLEATPAGLRALSALQGLARIDLCVPYQAIPERDLAPFARPDETLANSLGIERVGAPEVWGGYGIRGNGVLVAIMDTGILTTHPDLADHIWTNIGEIPDNGVDDDMNGYIDDVHGYDIINGDGDPTDDQGHGTHVSGTVAGDGTDGTNTGMAPGATLMAVKVLDEYGSGEEHYVWEGIQYATLMGAQVGNLSLGWSYGASPDRATWRQTCLNALAAGLTLCIAAGNEGMSAGVPNNLRTPGDVPEVITVGAVNSSDLWAEFSAVGPVTWQDISGYRDYPFPPGLTKPDVCAPGVEVLSTVITGGYDSLGYDGTSMATPHVTGLCALLLEADPSLTPADLKMILTMNALPLGGTDSADYYGTGRIQALSSVGVVVGGIATLVGVIHRDDPHYGPLNVRLVEMGVTYHPDSSDTFRARVPGGRSWTVLITAFGFRPESLVVDIPADSTRNFEITLVRLPSAQTQLQALAWPDESPVRAAFAQVSGTPLKKLRTDSLGLTDTLTIPFGTYRIQADKSRYISEHTTVVIDAATPEILTTAMIPAETFEDSSGRFTASTSAFEDWEWARINPAGVGPDTARSGVKCWGMGFSETYQNSTHSSLTSPPIDLAHAMNPELVFWHWFEFEASRGILWDGGNIKISSDDGPFELVIPEEGYTGIIDSGNTDYTPLAEQRGFGGQTDGKNWHECRVDLSAYVGHTIRVLFEAAGDDNTNFAGWFIDDFGVTGLAVPGPRITHTPLTNTDITDTPFRVLASIAARAQPISPGSTWLYWSTGVSWDSTALAPFGMPGNYRAEIPGQPSGTTVRYYLTAADTGGHHTWLPSNGPEGPFVFSVYADTLPPTIEPLVWPRVTLARSGELYLRVRVTDNLGVDTARVFVHYGRELTSLDSLPLRLIATDIYAGTIPWTDTGERLNLRLSAWDRARVPNRAFYGADDDAVTGVDSLLLTGEVAAPPLEMRGVTGEWEFGTPTTGVRAAHSPVNCWATRLGANYGNNATDTLILGPMATGGLIGLAMTFWQWYDFDFSAGTYMDGGNVKVSTNSGGSWSLVEPVGGYPVRRFYSGNTYLHDQPGYGGTSGTNWTRSVTFDLTSYVGHDLLVAFIFGSDPDTARTGWYLDDFLLIRDPSGIDSHANVDESGTLTITPRPVRDFAHVECAPRSRPRELTLHDLLGREVLRTVLPAGGEGTTLDLSTCPEGVYLLRVTGLPPCRLVRLR